MAWRSELLLAAAHPVFDQPRGAHRADVERSVRRASGAGAAQHHREAETAGHRQQGDLEYDFHGMHDH